MNVTRRIHPGSDESAFRQFALHAGITFVPVFLLGLLLFRSFTSEANGLVLQEAGQQVRVLVDASVEPMMSDEMMADGTLSPTIATSDNGDIAAIRHIGEAIVRRGAALRFRLRDLQGRIVWDASNPTTLPTGPVDRAEQAEMREVVDKNGIQSLTRLGVDDIDRSSGAHVGDRAIEAYAPVRSESGHAVGIAEVYLPFEPIAKAVNRSQTRILRIAALGLAFTWLVLAVLARATTRRFQRAAAHHRYVSRHDVLTGLPNRAAFRDVTASAIERAGRDGSRTVVAVLDLDGFKQINDTLGHHNGDSYLRHVGQALSATVTAERGLVARLGGDEFGIVLFDVSADSVETFADEVHRLLREEVVLDGVAVSVEASIGFAVAPTHGHDIESLLRNADLAMYTAKKARLATTMYSDELEHFSLARLSLAGEIRNAIETDQLVLHYQPKVDQHGEAKSVEALVRWNHPTRGMIPPADFLPVVEASSLIDDLSRWVIHHAIAQISRWTAIGSSPRVAVNLSHRNLRSTDLVDFTMEELRRAGVEPSKLIVEITETDFLEDPEQGRRVLEAFRAGGVESSLDDFGQGYTSLGHLRELPISELKIDRSFVMSIESDPKARAIIESIVDLGHRLNLNVIAEGVETLDQLSALCGYGCDASQGYLFSKPVPPDVITAGIRNTARRKADSASHRAAALAAAP